MGILSLKRSSFQCALLFLHPAESAARLAKPDQ